MQRHVPVSFWVGSKSTWLQDYLSCSMNSSGTYPLAFRAGSKRAWLHSYLSISCSRDETGTDLRALMGRRLNPWSIAGMRSSRSLTPKHMLSLGPSVSPQELKPSIWGLSNIPSSRIGGLRRACAELARAFARTVWLTMVFAQAHHTAKLIP